MIPGGLVLDTIFPLLLLYLISLSLTQKRRLLFLVYVSVRACFRAGDRGEGNWNRCSRRVFEEVRCVFVTFAQLPTMGCMLLF